MKFIKRAEITEGSGEAKCRIKAVNAPLLGPSYEVWLTSNGKSFHGKGRFPQLEGLMLKEGAPPTFYHDLVLACRRIGDQKSLEINLSDLQIRCLASLSLWDQDLSTISGLTGIDLESARRITFSLHREGFVTLVQKNERTLMALTPKGWRAWDGFEEKYGHLGNELLNKAIEIYTAREMEELKRTRPMFEKP